MNSVQNQTETVDQQPSRIFKDVKKKRDILPVYGHLQRLQLHGNKLNDRSYQSYTPFRFNETQQRLYSQLVYGIKDEAKAALPAEEISVIQAKHQRAQKIINTWKNEIVNSYVDVIFGKVFWHSDISKEMIEKAQRDKRSNVLNNMSFKDLGLEKRHVAEKLIKHKLLPEDFFQLTA